MAERFQSSSPAYPSYSRTRENVNNANKLQQLSYKKHEAYLRYTHQSSDWIRQHSDNSAASPEEHGYTEGYLVFTAAHALTAAKMLGDARRPLITLRDKYGHSNPAIQAQSRSIAKSHYLLDKDQCGVSLDALFEHGQALAREKPAEVYGHMLMSTVIPQDSEDLIDGVHAYYPVVGYSANELRRLTKQERFPDQTRSTLLELSSLYARSLRGVKEGLFDPDSPHFSAVAGLYEEIVQNGTSLQHSIFLSQVLGVNTGEQGRQAYSKIGKFIREDNRADFYKKLATIIEDSFDGLLGHELYELLGIERTSGAGEDEEQYNHVQIKKKQFLKFVKGAEGAINLPSGKFGGLYLNEPSISYLKNKSSTNVTLTATIQSEDGGVVPMYFGLLEKNEFYWSFLADHTIIPEVFNDITLAAGQAIDRAMLKANSPLIAAEKEGPAPKKEYYKDPVYDLRKLRQQESLGRLATAESTVQDIGEAHESPLLPIEVEFPEAIMCDLDADMLAKAEGAIQKYQRGLPNIRRFESLSENGRKVFRLRNGDMRVLVELKGDVLEVIGAGSRKTIYD